MAIPLMISRGLIVGVTISNEKSIIGVSEGAGMKATIGVGA